MRAVWAAVTVAFGCTASVSAQPTAPPMTYVRPAMAAYFTGTWTCDSNVKSQVVKAFGEPDGQPNALRLANAFVTPNGFVSGGRDLFYDLPGRPGTTTMNAGDENGVSFSGTSRGWSGEELVFSGERYERGSRVPERVTFTRRDTNRFERRFEVRPDASAPWRTTLAENCTRAVLDPAAIRVGACANSNLQATLVQSPQPVVPLAAAQSREGDVLLRVSLDERGAPLAVDVLRSPGDIFDRAAIDVAMRSTYRPAIRTCVPVAGSALVNVHVSANTVAVRYRRPDFADDFLGTWSCVADDGMRSVKAFGSADRPERFRLYDAGVRPDGTLVAEGAETFDEAVQSGGRVHVSQPIAPGVMFEGTSTGWMAGRSLVFLGNVQTIAEFSARRVTYTSLDSTHFVRTIESAIAGNEPWRTLRRETCGKVPVSGIASI